MKTIRQQLRAVPRILAGLLFAFMAAMASVVHASPSPPLWDGQPADVIVNADGHDGLAADQAILIKDAAELAYLAQQVNAGENLTLSDGTSPIQNNNGFPDIYFALSTDIDLNGEEWTPIGKSFNNPFQGHFNGDGHTVKGLKVNIQASQASTNVYAGLFGRVVNGTLRNLGVWLAPDGIVVSSSGNYSVFAGGLVGHIESMNQATPAAIRNCYVEAEGNGAIRITGNDYLIERNCLVAGGIAGQMISTSSSCILTHCYATVDVEAESNEGNVQVGGIAGYGIDVSYAYTTGKVEGRARDYLYTGGICGDIYTSIKNCLALNKEISCTTTGGGNKYKNRMAGLANLGVFSDNYATPGMKLNGQPATGGTTDNNNGADTWSDTFETALKSNPSPDNSWETAWTWTPGQLPQLRKENADGNGYSQDPVGGQTSRKTTDYLAHSPWDGSAATQIKSTGDGTFGSPILIGTAAELAYLAQQVNARGDLALTDGGNTTTIQNNNGFPGIYFALSADIDLEGGNWTPIGNGSNPFQGHFDGDGHVVKGLTVNGDMPYAGLFGCVQDGTLCNLGVSLHKDGINIRFADGVLVGGIVGGLFGNKGNASLRNCYVVGSGKVEGTSTGSDSNVGGIAGEVASIESGTASLTHCYATVAVEAEADNQCHVGGIVGASSGSNGTLSYTYATGSVKINGGRFPKAGGICGVKTRRYLTHNLALNSEVAVESGSDCHRIVGLDADPDLGSISSNYARPAMLLNGQPVTSTNADDRNGAPTWSNKLKEDLDLSSNEWNDAWIWEDGKLPQLKKLVDAGNNTYGDALSGQTPYSVEDYLSLSWKDAAAEEIENTGDGDGSSPGKAILIKDAAELAYLAQQVNAKGNLNLTSGGTIQNNNSFSGKYFALSADIDLEGGNWTPIGVGNSFRGHFDGRGHTVKGLTVNGDMLHAGLFGGIVDGTLCNLGVSLHEDGIKVSSVNGVHAGGIVGMLLGLFSDVSLRNCYVVGNGKVEGTSTGSNSSVGGIAGAVVNSVGTASFTHCYATVAVEAEATRACLAGGIVGTFEGTTLSYIYATGSVKANGGENQYAGGICGFKENGNLTHNLALNSEVAVESGSYCHRIVGSYATDGLPLPSSISSNYARPVMLLNGQPVTSTDANDRNGATTWSNKLKNDLDPSSNNEWNDAWIWEDGKLPKLKKLVDAGKNTYEGELSGQTPYSVEDYLYSSWADAAADRIENTGDGDGSSPGTPILIKDAAELAYLAQQVNARRDLTLTSGGTIQNNGGFFGKYFALSADIDLEGGNWTPIGNGEGYDFFRGHFDGRGYTVKGLTVNGEMSFAGLFGRIVDGTLCNLGVSLHEDGIKVSSVNGVHAGGIVGALQGSLGDVSLRNCYVVGNGKVEGTGTSTGSISYVGGIAGTVLISGSSTASFTHCYATVAVEAEATGRCVAGGIVGAFVGTSSATLSYTYATGSVKVNGGENQYAGGICGFKGDGDFTLTHNLALNSKVAVESGSDCHRIVGYDNNPDLGSISSNHARPAMLLNGQPVTSTDTDSFDGSDTWLDTYKADLGGDPASDNSWSSGNWTWTDSNLPQLRRVILDAGGNVTGYGEWQSSTQPNLPASSFLTNKPAPTPPPKPDPEPTVYHTVTLPAVEGVITDPVAGTYEVESWSTFRFYLTLDADYSESQPVITTSRNETLLPRPSDGAYQVKYVRNDVEVYIDGIVKNNPVANETLATVPATVRVFGSALSITVPQATTAIIFDLAGRPQRNLRLPDGETRVEGLPSGAYIVKFENGEVVKVIVTRSRT